MQNCGIAGKVGESISCIICGSESYEDIFDIEISPIFKPSKLVRCRDCGFFYAYPRPARDVEEGYYAKRYHEDQESGYWYDGRIDVFKRSLREIGRFLNKGRLIDVGCGMGYFMNLARDEGWEVKGMEMSESALNHAKNKLGLDVIRWSPNATDFEKDYFDAAVLWNVLDQIYDPRSTLVELNRVLKMGGYIFIRMPNLAFHLMLSKLWKRLKRMSVNIGKAPSVFHLYSFDKSSIRKLLESTGFSAVMARTEPIGVAVPDFVGIFGKKKEAAVRTFFDIGAKALFFLSFGNIIMSPSLFVMARKNKN